jgi:hypothetical protein
MRAAGGQPWRELLATALPDRFGPIAAILFGEEVPAVREINLWD